MDELQQALAALGLGWADVWRLTADRRAGTLVVVALDGRKLVGEMSAGHRPAPRGERKRRVTRSERRVPSDAFRVTRSERRVPSDERRATSDE